MPLLNCLACRGCENIINPYLKKERMTKNGQQQTLINLNLFTKIQLKYLIQQYSKKRVILFQMDIH